MAYITGTIASANPGADLYTAMATALTTAGYTLVDTVTISTRTHKIWKSAAANNVQALDWYVDVVYSTTGAGNMWLFPMEYYDPATDLAYRMVYSGQSLNTIETTYYTVYGATGWSLENANWLLNASSATGLALQVSTSSFGYWISITGDRIIALTSMNPGTLVYSGMFTPSAVHVAAAGASVFPLIYTLSATSAASASQSSAAAVTAALTRLPKTTALSNSSNWGYIPFVYNATAQTNVPLGPRMSDATTFFASRSASPISVMGAPAQSAGTPVSTSQAGLFGYLKDVAVMSAATTVARGDTVTINSETWIVGTAVSAYAMTFRAA